MTARQTAAEGASWAPLVKRARFTVILALTPCQAAA